MSESKQSQKVPSDLGPIERILSWSHQAEGYEAIPWDRMPEIDLYMDQVILYLSESLRLFQPEGEPSLLTSSMINNYVKNGLIPHPEKKKYRKEHLAGLIVLCLLKQVLPIPDVKALFSGREMDAAYQLFRQAHNAALQETCRALENTCRQEEDLQQAALLLAVEAAARRSAAQRVLRELEEVPGGKKSKAKPQPGEKP